MKERNNLTERFALYLKEVIEYYHANGSLKHFSIIAINHQITAIPQELFFKHGLDKMQNGNIPSAQQCEAILDDIRSRRKDKNKQKAPKQREPKFKAGSIVAWKHKNGSHGMAYIGEDDKSWFTMNRLGIEGEEEEIRDYSSLPNCLLNGVWEVIEPTKEDYERFIKALSVAFKVEIKNNKKQNTLF